MSRRSEESYAQEYNGQIDKRFGHPHGPSCPDCLEAKRCNQCGGKAPKATRCTNGRCPQCCGRFCKHTV